MTQQQLEAVRLIVKNYDVDGIRHKHDGSVVSYYGGVLYDYTEGCFLYSRQKNFKLYIWTMAL